MIFSSEIEGILSRFTAEDRKIFETFLLHKYGAALTHILEVYILVSRGTDRKDAIQIEAKRKNITQQTVFASISRTLNINAVEMDRLMRRDGRDDFRMRLIKRFKAQQPLIEQVFLSF
jgi:hypothetical protein